MNYSQSINVVRDCNADLSSRTQASALREQILQEIDVFGHQVSVDLSGVRTISHSFADELFAYLAFERGVDWFRDNIKVCNASFNVRTAILEAINDRLSAAKHGSESFV